MAQNIPMTSVLQSRFMGSWYPGEPEQLSEDIRGYLEKAGNESLSDVCALILPHAGYRYSGQTAAYGIKQVEGKKFTRVIVMGPSHHMTLRNIASLPNATHFGTPLGNAELDHECIDALLKHTMFQQVPNSHQNEHSVQMEIPLLQHALDPFKLVPIVVGQLDLKTAQEMASVLIKHIDKDTLVIASSDFTHYGSNFRYVPFVDAIEENLRTLDMGGYECIKQKDAVAFMNYVDKKKATFCGRNPIAILLAMLPGASKAHLLHYETSGNLTKDFQHSVSYMSIAFTGSWKSETLVINESEKNTLLQLARSALEFYYKNKKAPTPKELGVELTPAMKSTAGTFVTLTQKGMLRGCIGEIQAYRPLYESVIQNAIRSARQDPRFPPVKKNELPELHLEISVLTPPEKVASYDHIKLGKHGVILSKEGRKSVFLPQVALEQGWNLEQTLSHLSQKASLPKDAWKKNAEFSVFETISIGEAERDQ